MEKIAIKSDGTNEMGERIISYLLSLGGKNKHKYEGTSKNSYYYISANGNIDETYPCPAGYTEIFLNDEYPKYMWIGETEKEAKNKQNKRFVLCRLKTPSGKIHYIYENEEFEGLNCASFAMDIPQITEITLEEVAKKFDIPLSQLRIKD